MYRRPLTPVLVVMLLLSSALSGCLSDDEPRGDEYPKMAEISVVQVLTLTANAAPIQEYSINISQPFHIPRVQEVIELSTTPDPTETYQYKGQDWWYWSGSLERGATAEITLTYHMRLYSTLWEIEPSESGTIDDIPAEYDIYLGTEWKITPNDPQVQQLKDEIVGDETNALRILRAIYEWIDENLAYMVSRDAEPKSCSETLDDGGGDSDDQAILFASLARAAGVPAWLNLGNSFDMGRDSWVAHGWNNVLIPLVEGDGVIASVDVVYDQFLFRDPYHLSEYVDNGNGDDLEDFYSSWSYRYMGPSPQATSDHSISVEILKTSGSMWYDG